MSGDTTTVDSEMSTSVNSDASLDIDIVRHHDGIGTFRQTNQTVLVIQHFQWPLPLPTYWTPDTRTRRLSQKMTSVNLEDLK